MFDNSRHGNGRKHLKSDPLSTEELIVADKDAADRCGSFPARKDINGVPAALIEDVATDIDASGRTEVADDGGRPLVQRKLVVGQNHVMFQRHFIGRLVKPRNDPVSGIRLDGGVGNVDPSARVSHIDAVAIIGCDGGSCYVDITGTIQQLNSGHTVLPYGGSLHVEEAAYIFDENAAAAVIAH